VVNGGTRANVWCLEKIAAEAVFQGQGTPSGALLGKKLAGGWN